MVDLYAEQFEWICPKCGNKVIILKREMTDAERERYKNSIMICNACGREMKLNASIHKRISVWDGIYNGEIYCMCREVDKIKLYLRRLIYNGFSGEIAILNEYDEPIAVISIGDNREISVITVER